MTEREIKELRNKIEIDPILTDEEIEYIWMAMDKQEVVKPDSERWDMFTCECGFYVGYLHKYCYNCGQKLDWED